MTSHWPLQELGSGNWGLVLKGLLEEHKSLGESPTGCVCSVLAHPTTGIPGFLVAVKQLRSDQAGAAEELTREAAFMAQLNHDNIVKLHGVVTVS